MTEPHPRPPVTADRPLAGAGRAATPRSGEPGPTSAGAAPAPRPASSGGGDRAGLLAGPASAGGASRRSAKKGRDRRYRLYEAAVQTPERDVDQIERLYGRLHGGRPRTLREDFCGTALLSVRWVESDDEREATAVDLDPAVLSFAGREHLAPLDEGERSRVELVHQDVRSLSDRTFDVIAAMNFSWALLDDVQLESYLANARACLQPGGLMVLELFGGDEMRRVRRREHALDGFTYVWDQAAFDAEAQILDATISFRLDDGTSIDEAFGYRFHLRPVKRLRELLQSAGFEGSQLCVEDRAGRYVKRAREPKGAALWRGLLVGLTAPPRAPRVRR